MLDSPLHGLPTVAPSARRHLLETLLKRVSRAFYLSLRVLPGGVREPVSLAYLLARAADTIADTRAIAPDRRLEYLQRFRAQLGGSASAETLWEIGEAVVEGAVRPEERALLLSLVPAFSLLAALEEPDRGAVVGIVTTLISGMEMDLRRFPPEESGRLGALETDDELDRYTWCVAGCVGRFWTEVTTSHVSALAGWDVEAMAERGERLGKALQLVNVLRDVAGDLRIGRCYLPARELAECGLEPEDLLDPAASRAARPVLVRWIRRALSHFEAGEEYLLAIPCTSVRLRLAVLWPILIGLATLVQVLRQGAWLRAGRPARVDRRWVYRTLALSVPACLSDRWTREWIARWRRALEAALDEVPSA